MKYYKIFAHAILSIALLNLVGCDDEDVTETVNEEERIVEAFMNEIANKKFIAIQIDDGSIDCQTVEGFNSVIDFTTESVGIVDYTEMYITWIYKCAEQSLAGDIKYLETISNTKHKIRISNGSEYYDFEAELIEESNTTYMNIFFVDGYSPYFNRKEDLYFVGHKLKMEVQEVQ